MACGTKVTASSKQELAAGKQRPHNRALCSSKPGCILLNSKWKNLQELTLCKNGLNGAVPRGSLYPAGEATSFVGLFSKKEKSSNSGLLGIFSTGLLSRKYMS